MKFNKNCILFIYLYLIVVYSYADCNNLSKEKLREAVLNTFELGFKAADNCRAISKLGAKLYSDYYPNTKMYLLTFNSYDKNKIEHKVFTDGIKDGMSLDEYDDLVYNNCIQETKGVSIKNINDGIDSLPLK